jgi:histone demethylase JARID1
MTFKSFETLALGLEDPKAKKASNSYSVIEKEYWKMVDQ